MINRDPREVRGDAMRRILIVDDSKFIRLVTRRIVESLGFHCDEAEDGQKALQYCDANGPPDAIILDVVMPVMDGMEFLRAFRQTPQSKNCIVVMCTTRNDPDEIQAAVAAGANEYIMKPFTDDILAEKLRDVGILQ
jgi:two-component system chemotaxis response regulator CheY